MRCTERAPLKVNTNGETRLVVKRIDGFMVKPLVAKPQETGEPSTDVVERPGVVGDNPFRTGDQLDIDEGLRSGNHVNEDDDVVTMPKARKDDDIEEQKRQLTEEIEGSYELIDQANAEGADAQTLKKLPMA